MDATNEPRYRAWLLRCWEERGQRPIAAPLWRFSLENPHTGERHAFATRDALLAALCHALDALVEAAPPGDERPTTDDERIVAGVWDGKSERPIHQPGQIDAETDREHRD
jgi:hypothetical protein